MNKWFHFVGLCFADFSDGFSTFYYRKFQICNKIIGFYSEQTYTHYLDSIKNFLWLLIASHRTWRKTFQKNLTSYRLQVCLFSRQLSPFSGSSVYSNILPYFEFRFVLLNFSSVDPPMVPWNINFFPLPSDSHLTIWRLSVTVSLNPLFSSPFISQASPVLSLWLFFQLIPASGTHW